MNLRTVLEIAKLIPGTEIVIPRPDEQQMEDAFIGQRLAPPDICIDCKQEPPYTPPPVLDKHEIRERRQEFERRMRTKTKSFR